MNGKPKAIGMSAVKSSLLSAMGHDGSTLAVKFPNGKVYHYPGVTAKQFEELKAAKSVGSHFNAHIKSKIKGVPQ